MLKIEKIFIYKVDLIINKNYESDFKLVFNQLSKF